MAYVIKKPQENHLVCFGGWVPIGGLHKAIEEGNILPRTKGSLEVVTLAQMGLFAATSMGKKQALNHRGGWWIREHPKEGEKAAEDAPLQEQQEAKTPENPWEKYSLGGGQEESEDGRPWRARAKEWKGKAWRQGWKGGDHAGSA